MSTKQQRIAKLAGQMRGKALTSLSHHIDGAWLLEAWRRTRQDGAVGIDGQSAQQHAENLHGNLADLLVRAKRGRYKASPVKRVHICQPSLKNASLAVSLGSNVLGRFVQQLLLQVMQPLFERHFGESSHGFRPGRSAHGAIGAAQRHAREGRERVVDMDITKLLPASF